MNKTQNIVTLSTNERTKLNVIVRDTLASDKAVTHAKILLLSDMNKSKIKPSDQTIANKLNVSRQTIHNVQKKYMNFGLSTAVERKIRLEPPIKPKITNEIEHKIIQLSRELPPNGKTRWSFRLLAETIVRRNILDSISHEIVGRILRKYQNEKHLKLTSLETHKIEHKNIDLFKSKKSCDLQCFEEKKMTKCEIIINKIRELLGSDEFRNNSKETATDFTRNRKIDFADIILIILNMIRRTTQLEIDCYLEKYLFKKTIGYTKQSFSEARHKILPNAFVELNKSLVELFYSDGEFKKFKDYRILGIDGSKMQLPNNEQIRQKFGAIRNNLENYEIAQGLASTLFDLENKLVISSVIDRCDTSERKLAMKHIDDMLTQKKQDFKNLIIMDRGYPSFEVIKHIENANVKYLARTKSNFFKEVSQTNSNDEWVIIKITPSRKKHLKQQNYITNTGDSVIVRVVKFILSNGEEETLITNLSNEEVTYDDCTQLYFKRWGIETRYDELKNKFEIENFSGKTQRAVEQDFYATILLSNLAALIEIDANNLNESKDCSKKNTNTK